MGRGCPSQFVNSTLKFPVQFSVIKCLFKIFYGVSYIEAICIQPECFLVMYLFTVIMKVTVSPVTLCDITPQICSKATDISGLQHRNTFVLAWFTVREKYYVNFNAVLFWEEASLAGEIQLIQVDNSDVQFMNDSFFWTSSIQWIGWRIKLFVPRRIAQIKVLHSINLKIFDTQFVLCAYLAMWWLWLTTPSKQSRSSGVQQLRLKQFLAVFMRLIGPTGDVYGIIYV